MKRLTSIRLPELTDRQLAELASATGLNTTELITTAIDRMYQQEIKTMNNQTQQMLDEIKTLPKLERYERIKLEDKYEDKLPLASGTIAFSDDPLASIIMQMEEYVKDWQHASTITDIPYAPDMETCQRNIKRGEEILEYLRAK